MKIQNILLLLFFNFLIINSFSQEVSLKELKSVLRKAGKRNQVVVKNTLYSKHNKYNYFKSDTLVLSNHSNSVKNSPIMIWKLRSKVQFDLVEYNSEIEPPTETYSREHIGLKICLKKIRKEIFLIIKHKNNFIDKFKVLEKKSFSDDSFELKLVRIDLID